MRKHQYMSRVALQIFSFNAVTLKQIFVNICSTIFAQYSHASALDVVMVRVGGTLAPARERNSLKLQKNVRTKNTRPQSQHCHHCFCRPRMEHWKIFVVLLSTYLIPTKTISSTATLFKSNIQSRCYHLFCGHPVKLFCRQHPSGVVKHKTSLLCFWSREQVFTNISSCFPRPAPAK